MEKLTKPKSKLAASLATFFSQQGVLAATGLLALALAYVFASWAIDSGSLLDYAITILLIVVGIRDLAVAAFRKRSA